VVVVYLLGPVAGPRLVADLASCNTPVEGLSGREDGIYTCLFLQQVQHFVGPLVHERDGPDLDPTSGPTALGT